MEQKLSDTLVKAIDRSNSMMQNLQLASRFNKLVEEGGAELEDNHEITITENGEIEIIPTEGKDGMKKVTANVNVAGGADLEDNKEATIDVSAYTDPVEVIPTAGKDGMKKVTVSLSNIPSGGSATAYAWKVGDDYLYLNIDTAPNDPAYANNIKIITHENAGIMHIIAPSTEGAYTYTYVSDTEFIITSEGDGGTITETFTRDSTKDFTLWG